MTNKTDLAIVIAGGNGTRLSQYTANNAIPKVLLSLGNTTVLDNIIESLKHNANRIVIAVSSQEHADIINEYLDATNNQSNVHAEVAGESFGTHYAIYDCINKLAIETDKTFLISWSDLWADKTDITALLQFATLGLDEPRFAILADRVAKHRYHVNLLDDYVQVNKSDNSTGNVCGIYCFNRNFFDICLTENIEQIKTDKSDIIDVIVSLSYEAISLAHMLGESEQYIDFKVASNPIHDIGDTDKFQQLLANKKIESRFFNDIEFTDEHVIKSTTHKKGLEVMRLEQKFYETLLSHKNAEAMFPRVIDMTKELDMRSITMQNLRKDYGYTTMAEAVLEYPDLETEIISNVRKMQELLYNTSIDEIDTLSVDIVSKAIENEYIDVTLKRSKSVANLVNSVKVNSVQGRQIKTDLFEALRVIESLVAKNEVLAFGHGDLNSSNIMVRIDDRTIHDIRFIDPRGRFGDVELATGVIYDKAKLFYGLSGYTEFNDMLDFQLTISEAGDLQINESLRILDRLEQLKDIYDLGKEILLTIGLCWLKLPAYIINNPAKAIAAYYIGLAIISEYKDM